MLNRRDFVKAGAIGFSFVAGSGWALTYDPIDVSGGEFNNCIPFRKKPRVIREAVPGFLWADAADFQDYGGWALDTQHVGFMGSSYLIAHGTSKTVSDATLKLKAVKPGEYRLWIRSRNWIPEHAPGTFGVAVNGTDSGKTFGAQKEKGWIWQDGGVHELSGAALLTLQDKTGIFGRCSSIILTRDLNYQPPVKIEAFKNERARLSGVSNEIKRGGSYDVIVVGGGPSGGPAAIAAARTGAKTALVSNRPVLGGNSSAEIGVPVQGAAKKHPGKPVRETGIIEEAGRIELYGMTEEQLTKQGYSVTMSRPFKTLADAEPQLDLHENFWLEGVKKKGARITEVILVDTLTGERKSLSGKMFIDCTGDAWLGHHAGADERVGREAFSEYQEEGAPEEADNITMSACLRAGRRDMRKVTFHQSRKHETPQAYTPPPWIYDLPEEWLNGRMGGGSQEGMYRRMTSWAVNGTWWYEHPGDVDDLWDPEFARDELIRVNYTMWDYFKNHWEERKRLAKYSLDYVGFMAGKRESRRLMGDLVLNANDAIENRQFDDVIAHTGWTLDVHHHLGILSTEGPFTIDTHIPIGQIPYRCLYSRNIDNLLMAGRCASATHLALGTVRIQASCAVTGQAAGTAAGVALKHQTTPRGVYQEHMTELQQLLLKNDQYVPGIPNRDPADLALGAKVTATSGPSTADNVVNGIARPTLDGKTNTWESDSKQSLPQSIELTLEKPSKVGAIQCVFDTDLTVSMPTQRTNRVPEECVRDYTLECRVNGKWQRVVRERDNFQRFRRHQFRQVLADKVRLTVEATNGAETARVVELRVYPDAAPLLMG
ncbi:FAD-dependent oxidoreductase [Novipirellula artificiosorum]|uniref:Soluble pyridine nucleotide transhydrogenase n=1 Tax=Novipirellula artificiosorum TaxID=2528016 RepID=A0A5C6DR96_9BACT|nr:FAD-dependent oxidoreductase [Novipirellula artificiosorum]TWU39803.1 soluble pyridine nucleotide transhydrogenase [Novipirellula artificiosorum]